MDKYMLYDTATETLEAYQLMDAEEAENCNDDLRANDDSRRWLLVRDEDEEDAAELDIYRV